MTAAIKPPGYCGYCTVPRRGSQHSLGEIREAMAVRKAQKNGPKRAIFLCALARKKYSAVPRAVQRRTSTSTKLPPWPWSSPRCCALLPSGVVTWMRGHNDAQATAFAWCGVGPHAKSD